MQQEDADWRSQPRARAPPVYRESNAERSSNPEMIVLDTWRDKAILILSFAFLFFVNAMMFVL